jgi:UDP-N-acetylmuramoyl-tripeptide--D-alanyl-D-alanine ligase
MMKAINLQTLARFTGGTLHGGDGARLVTHVNTDSRKAAEGEVFVALVGDRFDGHEFVAQVAAAGTAAVIVSRLPSTPLPCGVIEVRDTLEGLQTLARNYREWHQPFVVGITGSSGKTSTKDLACKVMAKKHQVCATLGNLNNHIGLPLSILRLSEGDTCGVFEMGMNHPGEIAPLAAIAQPDVGIIVNVGVAHIEHMGSREAIALEKGMLAEAVHERGIVVLNATDDFTPSIAKRCRARVIQAGLGKGDVAALNLRATAEGTAFTLDFSGEKIEAFLPIPGEHMVANAALAAAAGWQSGISAADATAALGEVSLSKGRLETKVINGITFLDDSYNANPDSMKAGLRTLAGLGCEGRRVAVLGAMGELGAMTEAAHRQIGAFCRVLELDAVFTVGDQAWVMAQAAGALPDHFNTHELCAAALRKYLRAGDIVLLKGSRSAGMEKVLAHFQTS